MSTTAPQDSVIRAADGVALKTKLHRSTRMRRARAFALTLPVLAFILAVFIVPIADMLVRSFHDPELARLLPETLRALESWDGEGVPAEGTFEALARELVSAKEERTLGKAALRMNHELPGARSLLFKTAARLENTEAQSHREAFARIDAAWGEPEIWAALARVGEPFTARFYLAALDLRYDAHGGIVPQPEYRQIYLTLLWRTLWASALITILCLALGYPIAYQLANSPVRVSNLLLIVVLLPFWTSLLVRTMAWMVLLQEQGVINDLLVGTGVIGDKARLQMIYNMTGTIVAMTHIMLPFMALSLYSVMKRIPSIYMRAAQSLGANPARAFLTVYVPQTVPGIGAGCLLVFILSMGYYITPALVGGRTGQFISSFIAYHVQQSLNWGLAAALAGVVLGGVLVLYLIYNRLIGVENLRLG
ncbi:MAG: ABC transporter permease [Gammaproteobacteria bacterium]|nr:ABC transporter permease [Gammaproteobacteria bacterium]NIR85604.1 ABC transporter permease [Gammaproteobacteria bacterium]NIR90045.1 ABC transporter permease [Gammaproteobacteria bacterium]NIU06733.1 ABC transporter permease [Gammaproteobacteria bacterium]NIV53664.1 ABC transporter permease subunit [Gammaproteobacteria bacterium]